MNQPKKSGSKMPMIIIGLMVVLFLGVCGMGILAAIAVPAFTKYINKSKQTEAHLTTSQIATQVISYHLDNCAFPPVLEPSAAMPTSGEKVISTGGPGWDTLGLTPPSPSYFTYSSTQPSADTMKIFAEADFKPGHMKHTHVVELFREGETCLLTQRDWVENEFE